MYGPPPRRRRKVRIALSGLRDRALLAVMVYSFARVSPVGMNVDDYYQHGKCWWFRLHEEGGKHHKVPVHHKAEEYLHAYIKAVGIEKQKKGTLSKTSAKRAGTVLSTNAPRIPGFECSVTARGYHPTFPVPGCHLRRR
jgi:site-specific recombinase XerC